ncbi:MAG TPA: amidohydrolase family protein [Thermoplasmata archaeon]|nr:amidohydrolase family protein [Thermoplasmata archaeon]
MRNACVVFDGPTITYAGGIESAPNPAQGMKTHRVPAIMPGMWDCHGHLMGLRTTNIEDGARTPVGVMAARVTADAARGLLAGFTSVREVGGLGIFLARAIDEGSIPGPHVYPAGGMISPTGGHGDLHSFPLEFTRDVLERTQLSALADGVPECLKAVRSMLRLNARVIKICASGGVASEVDSPIHQEFSREELHAIVEEATRAERIVAAHCHGKPGILAALEAGCRTIEHGTYLDEEAADLFLEKDAILVPTRFIIDRLAKSAAAMGSPEYILRKIVPVVGRHEQALRLAIRKGVRIAVGTDIITSGVTGYADWGQNAFELTYLQEAGMKPLQAIEAATATGPLTLGAQAPKSGQLREGYDADILALAKSPVSDLSVLTKPENVRMIWKSGKLVKDLGA